MWVKKGEKGMYLFRLHMLYIYLHFKDRHINLLFYILILLLFTHESVSFALSSTSSSERSSSHSDDLQYLNSYYSSLINNSSFPSFFLLLSVFFFMVFSTMDKSVISLNELWTSKQWGVWLRAEPHTSMEDTGQRNRDLTTIAVRYLDSITQIFTVSNFHRSSANYNP